MPEGYQSMPALRYAARATGVPLTWMERGLRHALHADATKSNRSP